MDSPTELNYHESNFLFNLTDNNSSFLIFLVHDATQCVLEAERIQSVRFSDAAILPK